MYDVVSVGLFSCEPILLEYLFVRERVLVNVLNEYTKKIHNIDRSICIHREIGARTYINNDRSHKYLWFPYLFDVYDVCLRIDACIVSRCWCMFCLCVRF